MRFLLLFVFIIILISCNDLSKKDMAVLSAANESIEVSNKIIANNSSAIYNALQANLYDPSRSAYTSKWRPFAIQVKVLTDTLLNLIHNIKEKLIANAGGDFGKIENISLLNKTQPVNKIFFIEKNGSELNEQLATYKQKLFLVNEEFVKQFEKNLLIYTKEYQVDDNFKEDFTTTYFKNLNTLSALVLLNKIENNIRKIENDFVMFCLDKTAIIHGCGFGDQISSIVSQNSTVFKAGENIEITAGIGTFSIVSQPKIIVNDKSVVVNEVGVGIYNAKVNDTPGKHRIPLSIELTKPDGIKIKINKIIEYSVVE